ncbi:hypothetical protein [Chryseobacterium sp. Leaf394]|uniref:hypothetical protein n=1 Tax=Chryseobacterium sp. Leaf394 TaxID=1736361 RepID=UPI0006FB144F|nr:hypothetical protein [Chryseobacterium sp. Leaf394]KQS91723.1 hypothetical protein ASG21_04475 [Chryseobacterium sp. Leaf394]
MSKSSIEKRIARLTWNDNGWVKPSGRKGKSTNKDSHEGRHGYGHEEWLLDTGKIIDGYHYGFLEPIRKHQNAFIGKVYDVWLYSLNGTDKKRYFIGEINNVEVLDEIQADRIRQIYIANGWFDEMERQIVDCNANNDGFSDWKGVDLFNVRFKVSDINILGDYEELPADNKLYRFSRYTFAHFVEENTNDILISRKFKFISRNPEEQKSLGLTVEKTTYEREPKAIEVEYLHKAISKRLLNELSAKFGFENVSDELLAGYGSHKIDMVAKDADKYIFYEIKTYNSSRTSIRESLGQLLEYSCWIDNPVAHKLVIVSQKLADFEDAKKYIYFLRKKFSLPLYFQVYDSESDSFSEEL